MTPLLANLKRGNGGEISEGEVHLATGTLDTNTFEVGLDDFDDDFDIPLDDFGDDDFDISFGGIGDGKLWVVERVHQQEN